MKSCEGIVIPLLGSNIPSLYIGDGFTETLVQTRQRILGSEGPLIHRCEIVGHEVQYDDPRLPAEDFTRSPFAEVTVRHAVLTR